MKEVSLDNDLQTLEKYFAIKITRWLTKLQYQNELRVVKIYDDYVNQN